MGSNPWDFSQTMRAADEANFRDRQYANNEELRKLQMEDLRAQAQERQGLYNLRAGLPSYIEQNRASLYPTTGTRTIPGDTPQMIAANAEGSNMGGTPMAPIQQPQTSVYNIPAQKTMGGLVGEHYIKGGRPDLGLPFIQEERKAKDEQISIKMKLYEPIMKAMIESGNNEGFRGTLEGLKNDPDIGDFASKLLQSDITLTGKQEFKSKRAVKDGELKDPVSGEPIPAGTYELKFKGMGNKAKLVGYKPTEAKEFTPVSKTLYGPGGATKQVTIPKDGEYVPQKGWSLKEPFKPDKPDKPEYSPKQALTRISIIDSTIAGMKTTGRIDTTMAIQNPMLAGLVDVKDPAAVQQAKTSLEQERVYVSQFAPKGTIKTQLKPMVAPAKQQNKEWKKWIK